jgi:hypothetical protein
MLTINAMTAAIIINVALSMLSAISRRIATRKNDDKNAFIAAQSLSYITDIRAHAIAQTATIMKVSSSMPQRPTVIKMTAKEQRAPQIRPKIAEHTLRM